jgi:hypothetical protein
MDRLGIDRLETVVGAFHFDLGDDERCLSEGLQECRNCVPEVRGSGKAGELRARDDVDAASA